MTRSDLFDLPALIFSIYPPSPPHISLIGPTFLGGNYHAQINLLVLETRRAYVYWGKNTFFRTQAELGRPAPPQIGGENFWGERVCFSICVKTQLVQTLSISLLLLRNLQFESVRLYREELLGELLKQRGPCQAERGLLDKWREGGGSYF